MLTIAGLSAVLVPFTQPLAQPIRQPNPNATPTSLKRLSLEQLTSIEVTSVSRSRQSLGESAAAISIVTGEDIRRSGALTVPEALRLIPGIHAAQRNANSWAIASRGFSSVTSEKLLVLSDMRSIYTPLFSGVFWDAQDYVMEDIDRIEVIRGPGAALWGSNAVNGVINITTKSAQYTHGLHLGTGVGTEELARAAIRYGDAIAGQDLHYRVFAQYTEHDASSESFPDLSDDWRLGHVGVRADWLATDRDTVTMHAKAYRGNIGQLQPAANIIGRPGPQGNLEAIISGQYLQGRWLRTLGEGSELDFRAYYDHTRRNDPTFEDDLHTLDLDLQHSFQPTAAQHVTWGVNYRFTANRNEGKGVFNLAPPSSDDSLFSAFVQDQFSFADVVHLTLGTKLEHNDFSGFEWQPSVRAGWDVAPGQTLWAAVSRAVRVPTRLERDVAIDVTDPAGDPVARLLGSRDFESEELTAYEIGFRWQATDTLFLEFAAYHNEYDKLVSLEFGEPFLEDGRTIVPVLNRNLTEGHARGAEALVSYAPLTNWKVTASYAYIDMQLEPHGEDLNRGDFVEDSTPRHQFGLRSFLDLPGRWQLDTQFRTLSAVRRLPDTVSGEGVPGYSELDVRVAWEATEDVELSILGKNLLHEEHPEFGSPGARGEIQRSVYARIDARF
jgi:iron complex outermembrane receptor protein